MNNRPRNYSGIFSLFTGDKPDKTGAMLQRIGKIGFTLSFIGAVFTPFFNDGNGRHSLQLDIALGLFGIGFFVGLFMFIATGIHYSRREKGNTNFLASSAHVLKNTFLYLFVPVIIITILIVAWAIVTKQPAFQ